MRELTTVEDVIEALGGFAAAARLVGVKPRAAWNWRLRQGFPAETYLVIQAALNEQGLSGVPSLFGMRERARCA